MQADPKKLIETIGITTPLIEFYVAPDPKPFESFTETINIFFRQ